MKTSGLLFVLTSSALVALVGCDGDDDPSDPGSDAGVPEGTPVVSDDGAATLFVPEDALPEGVSVDDISITAIPEAEWFSFDDEQDPPGEIFAQYRLEPDGVTFGSPLTLRVTTDRDAAAGAITAIHVSDPAEASIESPAADLALDTETGRITAVSFELTHFSVVAVAFSDAFVLDTGVQPTDLSLDTDSIPVDSTFDINAGVLTSEEAGNMFLQGQSAEWEDHHFTLSWEANSTYEVTFKFILEGPIVLAPGSSYESVEGGDGPVTAIERTVVCDMDGPFKVTVKAVTRVPTEIHVRSPGDEPNRYRFGWSFVTSNFFTGRCVDPSVDAGTGGMSCMYPYQCGAGRTCGDGRCKDDSGSTPCTGDEDCTSSSRPVCEDSGGSPRCADCRTNDDCLGGVCVNNHCEDCDTDADCTGDTEVLCDPSKDCVECLSESDCAGAEGRPHCSADGACVQCESDAECTGPLPHCGEDGFCAQCTEDAHCSDPRPFCRNNRCNSCMGSDDCPSNALPSCLHSGCGSCSGDFSCSGAYTCERLSRSRGCTLACSGDGDCDATRGETCIGGQCKQCTVDGDCPAAAPHCDEGNCYECVVDADCPSPLLCSGGACVQCKTTTDCTFAGLPICVGNACDGCETDDHCLHIGDGLTCQADGSCQ